MASRSELRGHWARCKSPKCNAMRHSQARLMYLYVGNRAAFRILREARQCLEVRCDMLVLLTFLMSHTCTKTHTISHMQTHIVYKDRARKWYKWVWMCVWCRPLHVCASVCVCMGVCGCVFAYICVCVCMRVGMHVCMHTVPVYVHGCMCVCLCVNVFMCFSPSLALDWHGLGPSWPLAPLISLPIQRQQCSAVQCNTVATGHLIADQ